MNKLKLTDAEIKETVLFKEVAKVLDDSVALCLLKNTYMRYEGDRYEFDWGEELFCAFYWEDTKQGFTFWEDLHCKINDVH